MKVPLSGINTQELGQPFGNNAKQALSAVAFGKTAIIESRGENRYGRTLGYIFIEDQAINTMMVRMESVARWYRRYDKTEKLENAERYAKENKTGLWADKNPIAPWGWRKRKAARDQYNPESLEQRAMMAVVAPAYEVTQDWGGGFQAEIELQNLDVEDVRNPLLLSKSKESLG